MRDLHYHEPLDEPVAREVIFTACKGNPYREPRQVGERVVTFVPRGDGEYLAQVFRAPLADNRVAYAIIDKDDV